MKEEGKLKNDKGGDRGSKYVAKKKVKAGVNPHTGKKDANWSTKMAKKGKR